MNARNFNIDFLRYAEIAPDDVENITDEKVRAFISPDVHSFHLIWVYSDWSWNHEIVDYPYNGETLLELLEDELCDDSWDCGEARSESDFLELLSDWGDYSPDTPPVVMKISEIVRPASDTTGKELK